MLVLGVRELGGDGVDRGQHAANAETREHAPKPDKHDETLVAVVTMNMPVAIATRQPSISGLRPSLSATPPKTIEPIAMPMSSATRTSPRTPLVDAPLGADTRRRVADGQNVKPVESVEADGDRDDEDLHRRHRRLRNHFTRIAMHHESFPQPSTAV